MVQSIFLLLKYVVDYVKLTVKCPAGPPPCLLSLPQSLSAEHRDAWRALGPRHPPHQEPRPGVEVVVQIEQGLYLGWKGPL